MDKEFSVRIRFRTQCQYFAVAFLFIRLCCNVISYPLSVSMARYVTKPWNFTLKIVGSIYLSRFVKYLHIFLSWVETKLIHIQYCKFDTYSVIWNQGSNFFIHTYYFIGSSKVTLSVHLLRFHGPAAQPI